MERILKIVNLTLLVLLAGGILVYVTQSNHVAAASYLINSKKQEIKNLNLDMLALRSRSYGGVDFSDIDKVKNALGMVAAQQNIYVDISNTDVAYER